MQHPQFLILLDILQSLASQVRLDHQLLKSMQEKVGYRAEVQKRKSRGI